MYATQTQADRRAPAALPSTPKALSDKIIAMCTRGMTVRKIQGFDLHPAPHAQFNGIRELEGPLCAGCGQETALYRGERRGG
jgi:hypothetical protein